MDKPEILENYEKTRSKTRLPMDLKPCLMSLIDNKEKLEGDQAFILGCELHRVGKEAKRIEEILDSLNVKQSKIRSILKSLKVRDYEYGCPTLEDKGFCLFDNREECPWWDRIPRVNQEGYRERDFWRYGWPNKLKNPVCMLYLALREIEKLKGFLAGSRLYVSWDKLSKVSGTRRSSLGSKLEYLREIGLIEYTPGQKRTKGSKGLATQIKRIIPIPKPKI
ncbi:hypothetical protein ES702_07019 [subsurface metagenome]